MSFLDAIAVRVRKNRTHSVETFIGLALLVMPSTAAAAGDGMLGPPILPSPSVRIERTDVRGGGELYTYFYRANQPDASGVTEYPFVSVLRDTLGDDDPTNDRLREVWALTYAKPNLWHRITAAIPFFYFRSGMRHDGAKMPAPILDMAAPARGTPAKVIAAVVQSAALDPLGRALRLSSRSYRGRTGEYRAMQEWRAMDVLSDASGEDGALSKEELEQIQGRLLLSSRLLGGLVQDQWVPVVWEKQRVLVSESRGHNWELLRQRAEENGLRFQPLAIGSDQAEFAMLWVDQAAGSNHEPHPFNAKFLGIANPFGDDRIAHWKGYTQTWGADDFDANGAAGETRMVPLALYSLDHPRVPLLLVDFRDPAGPRRREMVKRASDDIATGVLGWTGFGHWGYMAAKASIFFVHRRHGGAFDRTARVRAYVQLRSALPVDRALDPRLRMELARRVDELGFNPLEDSSRDEIRTATKQYAALKEAAESGRLAKDLNRERSDEVRPLLIHNGWSRAMLTSATLATGGLYRHHEKQTPDVLAILSEERRFKWHRLYLESVLKAGSDPAVVANLDAVRYSIGEMTHLAVARQSDRLAAAEIVSRLLSRTSNESVRLECTESLQQLSASMADSLRPAVAQSSSTKIVSGGQ